MSAHLHPALPEELATLWPAVRTARVFADYAGLRAFHAEAPWRVQVSPSGELVLLERWRDHLDILAMRGLWAPGRHVPGIVDQIRTVASAHGYGRLLSPLIAEQVSGPYERTGMRMCEKVVVFRMDGRSAEEVEAVVPEGVSLGPAIAADREPVAAVDGECFSSFWAYEPRRLAEMSGTQRMVVARREGHVIGYTLSTVELGSGTLARLAVTPAQRGRGVGMALLADAVRYMARTGAGVISLCTQETNAASRELYARAGLRELRDRLVLLVTDV
jgi:ribosomal-protein-alanine N-acetyltransferase